MDGIQHDLPSLFRNHKSYFKFRLKKYCELFYISAEHEAGGLEKEQTTDTGGKMTEGDKRISYSTRPGCTATEITAVLIK